MTKEGKCRCALAPEWSDAEKRKEQKKIECVSVAEAGKAAGAFALIKLPH